jgi:replicative DNA helicase
MSDIRESGNIEAAADKILMLYRDEYYNPDTADKGIVEVIIAKGRDNGTGIVKMAWIPTLTLFGELEKFRKEK